MVDDGYWLDLGTPLSFVQGSRDLVLGKVDSSAVPGPTGANLILPGAEVAPDAVVDGGTVVGPGCTVAAGARVSGSVLMAKVRVGTGAVITDSVVATGAVVGERAHLAAVVIAEGASIGADVELLDGARVWPDAQIGDCAIRYSSDR